MNKNNNKIVIFITTSSKPEAEKIAEALVKERLSACCNIIDDITSFFWWEGKLNKEGEAMIIAKSSSELFEEIVNRVKELHSYKVPEIIALPIISGSDDYLNWIEKEVK